MLIGMGRRSPPWAAPFPGLGVLDRVREVESSGAQANKTVNVDSFLSVSVM